MPTESATIVLPLPPRGLSPNRPALTRGGRMAKVRATCAYRALARDRAREQGLASIPWAKAEATARFWWPDKKRRDIRNAEACLKAAYDGLVDAGWIVDDRAEVLTHGPTEFLLDPTCPRVELTLRRLDQSSCAGMM
jgi:hypothetical protein